MPTEESAFFEAHELPVFAYLSEQTKGALNAYLAEGNRQFRQRKLLEYFKSLDWVPWEEIDNRPLNRLSEELQSRIQQEVTEYQYDKSRKRQQASEKRQAYRHRIYAYYRENIPRQDKALLESLRDYELDLTGRDVNWRFHFTLDSFAKIDAFVQATETERQQWIVRFKKDVDAYKRNYEKLHHQAQHRDFTFDDWCEWAAEDLLHQNRQHHRTSKASAPVSGPLTQAYQTLGLPWGATLEATKKQFRKLTLKHHPDMPGGDEERMKSIIRAYETVRRAITGSGQ